MLRSFSSICTVYLVVLLSGCQTLPNQTSSSTYDDLEYRIELLKVHKRLRSGQAVFRLQKRHTSDLSKEWKVGSNDILEVLHVGDELIIDTHSSIQTDANGIFELKVEFKDPLKYFKWVKPSSYPIAPEFRHLVNDDVGITIPYEKIKPWKGWENAQIDDRFLIKLAKGKIKFWLPISYKDIRPLLNNLAHKIHNKEISYLTLDLTNNYGQPIDGFDVFLSGTAPPTKSLIEGVSTSESVKKHLIENFPKYLQEKDGGYDQTSFYVYPGNYLLEVTNGQNTSKIYISILKNETNNLERRKIVKTLIIDL